jgi:DNA polymerase elongation subunit (family B)
LGQGIDKYRSLFPHVSAAIQLASKGKSTTVSDGIEYIFTNAGHNNPLYRVIPTALIEQKQNFDYDKENIEKCC